jgi:hypothetical protein
MPLAPTTASLSTPGTRTAAERELPPAIHHPYDNPWRSANFKEGTLDDNRSAPPAPQRADDEWEYIWQCPRASRDRSTSNSTPIKDGSVGGGAGVGGSCVSGGGGGGLVAVAG